MPKIIFATRPSTLARWQTKYIAQMLEKAWEDLSCEEIVFTTKGDRVIDKSLPEIGGKGLFTQELEQALLNKRVHAAVHSLKDLPTEETPGLTVGAIPSREDARDAFVCPAGNKLETLPSGSVVGTSSNRRRAHLLATRPDLTVKPIRGNVDTRIKKVIGGQYDAIVIAAAGLIRLDLEEHITQYLPYEKMLPAPGQGALAIQCRVDDSETLHLLQAINHHRTQLAVAAERYFLEALGGGCSLPIGAKAYVDEKTVTLDAIVSAPDGSKLIRTKKSASNPRELGTAMAQQFLAQGAANLLNLNKHTQAGID